MLKIHIQEMHSLLNREIFTYTCMHAKSLKFCLTLCDPMNYSPPGSSVHGILQARILERGAFPFSRGSSRSRDWTWVSYITCIGRQVINHLYHLWSPKYLILFNCIVLVKRLTTMQETQVQSLDREDPLEKGMANHCSILAWRIPWTEESGRL